MHGLIFETSIWLLAGSTRLQSLLHGHCIQCVSNVKRKVRRNFRILKYSRKCKHTKKSTQIIVTHNCQPSNAAWRVRFVYSFPSSNDTSRESLTFSKKSQKNIILRSVYFYAASKISADRTQVCPEVYSPWWFSEGLPGLHPFSKTRQHSNTVVFWTHRVVPTWGMCTVCLVNIDTAYITTPLQPSIRTATPPSHFYSGLILPEDWPLFPQT